MLDTRDTQLTDNKKLTFLQARGGGGVVKAC
jgi:hypothetical protein